MSNENAALNHDTQHAVLNNCVSALETKIGVDNSAVTTSLDYLVKSAVNPGHTHDNYVALTGNQSIAGVKTFSGGTLWLTGSYPQFIANADTGTEARFAFYVNNSAQFYFGGSTSGLVLYSYAASANIVIVDTNSNFAFYGSAMYSKVKTTFHSTATDTVPLGIKGYTGQATYLTEWRKSTGGAILAVDSTGQLISAVATGTSPFSVTSTTVNSNLNADMVDGVHGTYIVETNTIQTITAKKTFNAGCFEAAGSFSSYVADGVFGGTALPVRFGFPNNADSGLYIGYADAGAAQYYPSIGVLLTAGSAFTSTLKLFQVYRYGESALRYYVTAAGTHVWGDGTNTPDTNLYRGGANVLKTDDTFTAGGYTAIAVIDDSISAAITTLHSNLSQGLGFGYNTMAAIGSSADVSININAKGTGYVRITGPLVALSGYRASDGSVGISATKTSLSSVTITDGIITAWS